MTLAKRFTDPSQNFILRLPRDLDAVFKPKSVALIGAKDEPGSVGCTLLANLIQNRGSFNIYPVNPKRTSVLGMKCYANVGAIPEKADLAIIVTPAATVPAVMKECAENGVKSVIIISAGFKELGQPGLDLENAIVKTAREAKIPIIGPNCLGVMNPIYGLNATFAKNMALPGNIAFISQSGAMCTSVLDWSLRENIGFSSFVSIGSMADVDWGDLIDYLGGDPATHSLLMYMETIGDPRKFLSAAREIALEKPIIVIKAGRTQQAANAAASHTGSLAGSDDVFDAALERVGVLRVDTIAELFQMASVLSRQPRPKGPRLTIVTNAGGPGVLATDAAIAHGAELGEVKGAVLKELNTILPPAWSHANPVDILGDARPERFADSLAVLSKDDDSDGVLIILTPQDMTDPTATANAVAPYADLKDKPLLASWMGGSAVSAGIEILNQARIPTFEYPDDAAAAFATMWRYSRNLRILYQVPKADSYLTVHAEKERQARVESQAIIQSAALAGKSLLDEFESKKVLAGYGIPIVQTEIAITSDEAVAVAERIGFPAVLKLFSKTITHKSDVGGVKLNLKDADSVRKAFDEIKKSVSSAAGAQHFQGVTVQKMIKHEGYELILGMAVDPQFGPTLLFGMGGVLVEVFKDRALGLPPLNSTLARLLMEKTKIYSALKGVRGRPGVDLDALEKTLVQFSRLIAENPRIKECDINPLIASHEGIVALDARIVLFDASVTDAELPKLAIRPYPVEYVEDFKLQNGQQALIRPISPEDEPLLVALHKELSENSIRQRFFEFVSLDMRTAHERLVRICFNDFDREIAIVAEIEDPKTRKNAIIGVLRISRIPGTKEGILTMIISDSYHGQGLGKKLMQQGIHIAQKEHLERITAHILDENVGMLKICKDAGFYLDQSADKMVKAQLKLPESSQ